MGVLFSLLAGIFLGLFQSFNGRAREELAIRKGTLTLLLVSTAIVGSALLLDSGIAPFRELTLRSLLWFGSAGLLHFILGWTLLSVSQGRVGAGRTGILVGATPIFAAALGLLLLKELISFVAFIGVLLVVAGVVTVSYDSLPEDER